MAIYHARATQADVFKVMQTALLTSMRFLVYVIHGSMTKLATYQ